MPSGDGTRLHVRPRGRRPRVNFCLTEMKYGVSANTRHSRESGCNPIPRIRHLRAPLVVPAKAGTQGFQPLAPGSTLARGRRICLSARFSDSSPPAVPSREAMKSVCGALSRRKPGPTHPPLVPLKGGPRLSPGKRALLSAVANCLFLSSFERGNPDPPASLFALNPAFAEVTLEYCGLASTISG
jgi:hypothetical protein